MQTQLFIYHVHVHLKGRTQLSSVYSEGFCRTELQHLSHHCQFHSNLKTKTGSTLSSF